ncbi:MAG: hypothetical protein R2726_16580 [Acidimicrobiales bacterium]
MNRPEDGSWDPSDPANFYFNTTASFGNASTAGISRSWQLRFSDPKDLTKGGTASVAVASPPFDATKANADQGGPRMLDNLTVNDRGKIIALEDVGNNAYLGGVFHVDPSTGATSRIAQYDPELFTPGLRASSPRTRSRPGSSPCRSWARAGTSSTPRCTRPPAIPPPSRAASSCCCRRPARPSATTGATTVTGARTARGGRP